jgi:hypothetical protein
MSTLCKNANIPAADGDHPLARIIGEVRQASDGARLNFVLADRCIVAARDHWHKDHDERAAIEHGVMLIGDLTDRHLDHPSVKWKRKLAGAL